MSGYKPATGELSARIHGAQQEMRERAKGAYEAALDCEPIAAAALRGKGRGYNEAALMLEALQRGHRIPKRRRWTGRVPPVRSNRRSVALGDAEAVNGSQSGDSVSRVKVDKGRLFWWWTCDCGVSGPGWLSHRVALDGAFEHAQDAHAISTQATTHAQEDDA